MSLDGTPGVKSNATSSGPGASGAGVVARRDADRGVSPSPSAGSDKQLTEKELRVGLIKQFLYLNCPELFLRGCLISP